MSGRQTASEVFDKTLTKVLDPSTRSEAISKLIKEMEVYHNSQFIFNNHTSISLIFDLFRLRSERTPELVKLIVLFVISGYRTSHPATIAQFKEVAVDEYSVKELRAFCIMGLAVFRLFMDVGVEEKRRIKAFIQPLAVDFGSVTQFAAHISYMSTLNYQEYLKTINITEAQVPDPEQNHKDHLVALVLVLEHFLSTDGLVEHEDNNKGVNNILEFLRSESRNIEDDGFILLEEDDHVELNVDADGFVHM